MALLDGVDQVMVSRARTRLAVRSLLLSHPWGALASEPHIAHDLWSQSITTADPQQLTMLGL